MSFVINDDNFRLLYLGSMQSRDADTDNCFTHDWCAEMEQNLSTLEASIAAGEKFGLIITADGKFFSNGLDIGTALGQPDKFSAYIDRVDAIYARVLLLGVPTVTAINGHAFGAGAMLTLCTDYSVMRTSRGYFSLPEVALGMHFPAPMMSLLKATLPSTTVREAVLTAKRYDSSAALANRIITAEVEIDSLIDTAKSFIAPYIPFAGRNYQRIKTELFHDLSVELTTPIPEDFPLDDVR